MIKIMISSALFKTASQGEQLPLKRVAYASHANPYSSCGLQRGKVSFGLWFISEEAVVVINQGSANHSFYHSSCGF